MTLRTALRSRLGALARALDPASTAFVVSLLLSLFAITLSIAPNNDGMLYVEAAEAFQRGGLAASQQIFDWAGWPVLIATVSSLSGLTAHSAAYALSALLLAGTCALVVLCAREHFPQAGWAAFAVSIALPSLNAYRDYIMREYGAWFFVLLGLWLTLRAARSNRLLPLLGAQLAICVAAVFRPECLIFLLALPLFELTRPRGSRAPLRLLTASLGLIAGAAGLLAMWSMGELAPGSRLAIQLSSAHPAHIVQDLRAGAEALAGSVLNKYSADEAGSILVFGLLSILPMKFIGNLGLFCIPALYALRVERPTALLRQSTLFAWAFALYALVLLVFLFNSFFLTSRYVALLALLCLPLAALGLHALLQRGGWVRPAIIALITLTALSHVISTTPPKTRYADSAAWIRAQGLAPERIYFEDPTVAYLAGMGFSRRPNAGLADRHRAAVAAQRGRIDYLVLSGRSEDPAEQAWAVANRLDSVMEFADERGRAIRIYRRTGE
mgnify:CR=1 FL=1